MDRAVLDADPPSALSTPRRKRLAQVFSSIFFCFFLAGTVFGFAALKPILLDSGVYSQYCRDGERRCKEQDTRLNTLFVIASSINNIAALPMGTFLDRVGPRAATLTGGVLCLAGNLIFSLGIVTRYFDSYLVGYSLLGLSTPAIFLAQFHLSNAFPARSGLILGAVTGAFDASSLSLCLYKVAYFRLDGRPSLKTFFLCYSVLPVLLIVQQLTFGPTRLYERLSSNTSSDAPNMDGVRDTESGRPATSPLQSTAPISGTALSSSAPRLRSRRMSSTFSRISYDLPDTADDSEVKEQLSKRGDGDPVVGALYGVKPTRQIMSKWWFAMEFLVIIHMTRINWYLTTVSSQLVYYTGNESLADKLTDAFIFLLPLAGIVSIPAIGWLLDTRPILHAIIVMLVMGLLFGILTLLHSAIPQLIGLGVLVVFRPLFYTALSDYGAKVFGFETFGTVYGLGMSLSGLFGFILTPLDLLTKGPLHGSYTVVNTALLVLGLLSALGMIYQIWSYSRGGKIRLQEGQGEHHDDDQGRYDQNGQMYQEPDAIQEEEEDEEWA